MFTSTFTLCTPVAETVSTDDEDDEDDEDEDDNERAVVGTVSEDPRVGFRGVEVGLLLLPII